MKLPRRTFLHLAAGTAALPIASPVAVLGQGTTIPTGTIRIVERTHYYAKPGLAAEVLDQDVRLPPYASRSDFRSVKYLSNILAVTAANRMSLGNAPSPTQPHARQTSRRAQQARNLKAFVLG